MAKVDLSLQENIETLKRTNLPTVVTEGSDDYRYYRRIEEGLSALGVSLFPVGGRSMVLKLFERRKELGRNDILFISDSDLWVFSGTPEKYNHRKLILTDGYSFENDLYRDGKVEDFLYETERGLFHAELNSMVEWYSHCIDRLLLNKDACISDHPNRVLGEFGSINVDFAAANNFSERNETIYQTVIADYQKLLRGKTLLDLLLRHLSASKRDVKFGRKQLMEIAVARGGNHYLRIGSMVESFFRDTMNCLNGSSEGTAS